MENKNTTRNNHFPKVLFIFCLPLLSSLIAAIAWIIHNGSLAYFCELHLFWDFSFYFSLFSFILVRSKRKVAFILSIIATAFSIANAFYYNPSVWDFYSIKTAMQNIPHTIYPPILCVLLTIYCASPHAKRCYLFAGITGSLLVILTVLTILSDGGLGNSTTATVYLLGFLTNTDTVGELVVSRKKKGDITSALDKLERFAQLKEDGILTAEEFEAKKHELMNQM